MVYLVWLVIILSSGYGYTVNKSPIIALKGGTNEMRFQYNIAFIGVQLNIILCIIGNSVICALISSKIMDETDIYPSISIIDNAKLWVYLPDCIFIIPLVKMLLYVFVFTIIISFSVCSDLSLIVFVVL